MASPDYTNIILNLSNQVDMLTKTFVFDGYRAMSQALAAPIGSLCVLFIVLTGYGILRGVIKTPMKEFMKIAIRIGVIYMLALNWDLFSEYVVGLFMDGASELGGLMMKLSPFNVPMNHGFGINGGLQSVFTETISIGEWVSNKGNWRHFGPCFTGGVIDLAGFAVVGLAFFELVVAKLMLAICMSTAPLFVSFRMFDQTRSYFDKWLGSLVGFSLVLIFVSAVVGFCMNLLHWSIGQNYANHADTMASSSWVPILFVACLSVKAILEVTGIAKSIGGSCSTGTGSSMVGSVAGGAMGAALGASKLTGLTKLSGKARQATQGLVGRGLKKAGGAAFSGLQKRLRGN